MSSWLNMLQPSSTGTQSRLSGKLKPHPSESPFPAVIASSLPALSQPELLKELSGTCCFHFLTLLYLASTTPPSISKCLSPAPAITLQILLAQAESDAIHSHPALRLLLCHTSTLFMYPHFVPSVWLMVPGVLSPSPSFLPGEPMGS